MSTTQIKFKTYTSSFCLINMFSSFPLLKKPRSLALLLSAGRCAGLSHSVSYCACAGWWGRLPQKHNKIKDYLDNDFSKINSELYNVKLNDGSCDNESKDIDRLVTWSLVSDWSIRPTFDKSHSGRKIMKRIDWFYLKVEIKHCKVFYFYGSPDWKKIETVGDLMDDKVNWILASHWPRLIRWPEYWPRIGREMMTVSVKL